MVGTLASRPLPPLVGYLLLFVSSGMGPLELPNFGRMVFHRVGGYHTGGMVSTLVRYLWSLFSVPIILSNLYVGTV